MLHVFVYVCVSEVWAVSVSLRQLTLTLSVRGGFLYRLLRPELVKSNAVPLSSNALSNWTMDDSDKADQDVRRATHVIHTHVTHVHQHQHQTLLNRLIIVCTTQKKRMPSYNTYTHNG